MNPEHSDGQHKAYVFRSALGIGIEEVEELRDALLQAVRTYDAVPGKSNQYGQKYLIDLFSHDSLRKTGSCSECLDCAIRREFSAIGYLLYFVIKED